MIKVKRRKVEDGAYELRVEGTDEVLAIASEQGKSGYRWTVDRRPKGSGRSWDSETLGNVVDALEREHERCYVASPQMQFDRGLLTESEMATAAPVVIHRHAPREASK